MKGLSPEVTAYIPGLETQISEKQVRINRLTDMLAKLQKSMFGQSSEKSRYVLGEDFNQLSLFNEAELESNSKAPEPTPVSISGHTRKVKRQRKNLPQTFPWWKSFASWMKENGFVKNAVLTAGSRERNSQGRIRDYPAANEVNLLYPGKLCL